MGYSYEAFSTYPPAGEVVPDHEPEGWAGSVNQNVQVGPWASATPNRGEAEMSVLTGVQWCNVVRSAIGEIPMCLGGEVDCVNGA
jgi:RAT1-interacting protein